MASHGSLLEIIGEIHEVLGDAAEFSFVDCVLRDLIVPYTEKWRRRTLKLIESIGAMKDIVASARNFSVTMVHDFNHTVAESSQQMTKKMATLAELFDGGGQQSSLHDISMTLDPVESLEVKEIVVKLFLVVISLMMMPSAHVRDRAVLPRIYRGR
jgi:hypothetical protein